VKAAFQDNLTYNDFIQNNDIGNQTQNNWAQRVEQWKKLLNFKVSNIISENDADILANMTQVLNDEFDTSSCDFQTIMSESVNITQSSRQMTKIDENEKSWENQNENCQTGYMEL